MRSRSRIASAKTGIKEILRPAGILRSFLDSNRNVREIDAARKTGAKASRISTTRLVVRSSERSLRDRYGAKQRHLAARLEVKIDESTNIDIGENIAAINQERLLPEKTGDVKNFRPPFEQIRLMNEYNFLAPVGFIGKKFGNCSDK